MTGRELLRRLRVAIQDAEEPYRHSTDQLWRWMQAANLGIQRQSQQWDFMHKRGLFITTNAVDETYAIGRVREIAEHSLYYTEPGLTAHNPMTLMRYEDWSYEQQSGTVRDGPPLFLVENPDQSWRPYPKPNGVYNIYADWWLRPSEMANVDAEPLWEVEFHEILLYEAMEVAANLEPQGPRAAVLQTEVAKFLPPLRRAFNSRYLPTTVNPSAIM